MERVAGIRARLAGYTDAPIVREAIMFSRRYVSLQRLARSLWGFAPSCRELMRRASVRHGPHHRAVSSGWRDRCSRPRVAHELQTLWGQSSLPRQPGASGLLGSRQVATAPADGYTLLLASTGAILSLAANQNADANYRIERELAPVSLIAAPPYIVVSQSVGAREERGGIDRACQSQSGTS